MNLVDILILISVILIVLLIIFFSFIFPLLRGKEKAICNNCPTGKNKAGKRLVKNYNKKYAKKQDIINKKNNE